MDRDGSPLHRAGRLVGVSLPWVVAAYYALVPLDGRDDSAGLLAAIALGTVQGVALVWRHDRPEVVTAAVLVAAVPFHLLVPELVVPFAGLVAVGSLASSRPPRVSLIGLAGLLGVSAVNFVTTTVDDTIFTMAIAVGAWALGEASRNRRAAITEAARRAAGDEQARIARELHDVIAHTVSVIVVQAGAAGDVFDARPEQARAALRSIEDAGRDALRELRRLLSPVRSLTPAEPAPPQPGLARIAELTEPLRAAGLEVVVISEGPSTALPAGVDVSAYRIVQEALTNVVRHARATLAEVTFRYSRDDIEIEVVDDGRPAPDHGERPGYGLIGMRERTALLGGTFEAGPTAHGGYRVHARLPLDAVR